jgi:hypothetical protein
MSTHMSTQVSTQAQAILRFYKSLKPGFRLPKGISIMNPFEDEAVWPLTTAFYEKFYGDRRPRIYILGINPGRFGGGVTGVPFTDPIRLEQKCGIPNDWRKLPELSSQFIYEMIDTYGGVAKFYGDFFITAMSPLGFVRDGRNLNYYDDKALLLACEPFMADCLRRQLATIPTAPARLAASALLTAAPTAATAPTTGPTCFCLGEGQNFRELTRLNTKQGFFSEIIPLPHPRWIMQYRRPRMKEFADLYVSKLSSVSVK